MVLYRPTIQRRLQDVDQGRIGVHVPTLLGVYAVTVLDQHREQGEVCGHVHELWLYGNNIGLEYLL